MARHPSSAASVVTFTDTGAASGLKVEESSTAVGWTGVSPPKTPNGQSMVGVTLSKSGSPSGGAFSKQER